MKWILEGKLAQSPMPRLSDIPKLARRFTGIVVLAEASELPLHYLDTLAEHGLEVLHAPTRDFHPVELLDLLKVSIFIERHIEKGGSVLVHCIGGLGRSGVATASYLVFKGYTSYDAIRKVRSTIPGSIENPWQSRMVRTYEVLVNKLRELGLLDTIAEGVQRLERRIYRHASKVLQFHIELHDPLYIDEESMIRGLAKITRKYIIGEDRGDYANSELCLPEALDYDYSSRVVTLSIDTVDKPIITLLCDDDCSTTVRKAGECSRYVAEIMGGEPVFNWGYYTDYV
ncbi:MAG: dual specificity protein phosphatase family protein [Desulfurococcus sp.]|nr:dual specificity protein phosphatase family protein [Desulfurococcus sp.]